METTTDTTTLRPEALAAGKWWGDQLRGKPNQDIGDNGLTGAMFAMLTAMTHEETPSTDADKFAAAVAEYVSRRLERGDDSITISTDYDPGYELSQIADECGVNIYGGKLPAKTYMWIDSDAVSVSCGYRAPVEHLYPIPAKVESDATPEV